MTDQDTRSPCCDARLVNGGIQCEACGADCQEVCEFCGGEGEYYGDEDDGEGHVARGVTGPFPCPVCNPKDDDDN